MFFLNSYSIVTYNIDLLLHLADSARLLAGEADYISTTAH